MLLPYIAVGMFGSEDDEKWNIDRAMGEVLRSDLDAPARMEGASMDVLAKQILKLYVGMSIIKKARELPNFEDRLDTAVLLELKPQLEMLRKDINELKILLRKPA